MCFSIPTTVPDASGRYRSATPVEYVAPVDGWRLVSTYEEDSDHFETPVWIARGPTHDIRLDTSRFRFDMTQARFAWFVRNGFPRRQGIGPWTADQVDAEIFTSSRFNSPLFTHFSEAGGAFDSAAMAGRGGVGGRSAAPYACQLSDGAMAILGAGIASLILAGLWLLLDRIVAGLVAWHYGVAL